MTDTSTSSRLAGIKQQARHAISAAPSLTDEQKRRVATLLAPRERGDAA